VTDPRVVRRFELLVGQFALSRVSLTQCEAVGSPLVIGRREVCVPLTVLSGLCDEDCDAVLAHELAHLERGDGWWFPLVGAVQHALWFQPLNHFVASRFRRTAEHACDDRAVALTRNPLALGRAIVRLAEAAGNRSGFALAPAIVSRESELRSRVRRLVKTTTVEEASAGRGMGMGWTSAVPVGLALAALSFRVVPAPRTPSVAKLQKSTTTTTTAQSADAQESARMAELVKRDQQLTAALERLSHEPGAWRGGASVRALELEQELRHVRASEAWLEQRFVAGWSANDPR